MRTLTFEQITDSRFEPAETILETLRKRIAAILEKLDIDGILVKVEEPRLIDWDDHKQYRARFWVNKSTRQITWNDVYEIVNSIKAVPYKFV